MNIGAGLIPIGFSLFSVIDTQPPRPHEPVELNEKQYEFRVMEKEPINHSFYFTNWTGDTLQVANVSVSEPIGSVFVTPKVRPGKVGRVDFSVAEPRPEGNYDGKIEIRFKDRSVSNVIYKVTGRFLSAMEVSPLPAFFVTSEIGKTKSTSLDIFNHTAKPVEILSANSSSERFDLRLSTIDEGQHYRLELKMRDNVPAGRATESITVTTSDPQRPSFTIPANTLVREKVYASSERVDLGHFDLKDVSDNDPEKFSSGKIDGAILLGTNDKEISQVQIPVTGILASEGF